MSREPCSCTAYLTSSDSKRGCGIFADEFLHRYTSIQSNTKPIVKTHTSLQQRLDTYWTPANLDLVLSASSLANKFGGLERPDLAELCEPYHVTRQAEASLPYSQLLVDPLTDRELQLYTRQLLHLDDPLLCLDVETHGLHCQPLTERIVRRLATQSSSVDQVVPSMPFISSLEFQILRELRLYTEHLSWLEALLIRTTDLHARLFLQFEIEQILLHRQCVSVEECPEHIGILYQPVHLEFCRRLVDLLDQARRNQLICRLGSDLGPSRRDVSSRFEGSAPSVQVLVSSHSWFQVRRATSWPVCGIRAIPRPSTIWRVKRVFWPRTPRTMSVGAFSIRVIQNKSSSS